MIAHCVFSICRFWERWPDRPAVYIRRARRRSRYARSDLSRGQDARDYLNIINAINYCRKDGMSAAVALLIVVIVVAAIAFVAFLASRIAAVPPAQEDERTRGLAPGYRHAPETVRYYGQQAPDREQKPSVSEKRVSGDPRQTPLPRCPACGAAIAYGEVRCPKCGTELASLGMRR